MKIDRHLAIINLLTQYKQVTAPFLAERLEVSRRTITRDLEDLCMAGVPIVTTQGNGGGISLMEGYTLDKTLFKKGDLSNIVTALKGLNSVNDDSDISLLLNRIASPDTTEASVIIDLASHYKGSLSKKIQGLKLAIQHRNHVSFQYYSPKGRQKRQVEPYKVIYQWANWYLLGYCLCRQDFRMFKLNRLWELSLDETTYHPKPVPEQFLDFSNHLQDERPVEALFSPSVEYILVEDYGPQCFETTPEGLLFKGTYTNIDFISRWLYGFGDQVTVLGPPELVAHLQTHVMKFTPIAKQDI